MKKLMMWYLKVTVIANGSAVLLAWLIGQMIRAGWIKNRTIVWYLGFFNDVMTIQMKSLVSGKLTKEEDAE